MFLLFLGALLLAGCPSRRASPRVARDRVGDGPRAAWPSGLAPTVRVRLSGPSQDQTARIKVRGEWTLLDLDGAPLRSGRGLDGTFAPSAEGWTLADLPAPVDGAELVPAQDGDLAVGTRRHTGSLRISRSVDRRYRLYVETSMSSYLEGVIGGEIPAAFPRESQRTQAIIARTYALSRAPAALHGDPLLLSDSGRDDQEYTGIAPVDRHRQVAHDAVASTRGEVVLYRDAPVKAWYHSTCGGHTCPSGPVFDVPTERPLAGVPCTDCRASKYFDWTARIPAERFVRAAGLTGRLEDVKVARTTAGGRATHLAVRADGREAVKPAGELRLAVGPSDLRSVLIRTIRVDAGLVVVSGNGWGHGVGLCQMGAKGMAEQGRAAEEIIARYYPGAEVAKLW